MPFRNVLNPSDLAILRGVFTEHCQKYGISSPEARNSVAESLMHNYRHGVDNPDELKAVLDREESWHLDVAV